MRKCVFLRVIVWKFNYLYLLLFFVLGNKVVIFVINEENGVIIIVYVLDYENVFLYILNILVIDRGILF